MTDELGKIWKEAAIAWPRYNPGILWRDRGKAEGKLKVVRVRAEIRA
jgi:hypothetical protein